MKALKNGWNSRRHELRNVIGGLKAKIDEGRKTSKKENIKTLKDNLKVDLEVLKTAFEADKANIKQTCKEAVQSIRLGEGKAELYAELKEARKAYKTERVEHDLKVGAIKTKALEAEKKALDKEES